MKTVLNVKTDSDVKHEAMKTAKALGVPLSVVVNACLKEFNRNKSLTLSLVPRMTPALEALTGRVVDDIKHKRNLSEPINSRADMERFMETL